MSISKIKYSNTKTSTGNFEIITLPEFFSSVSKTHLERDYRVDFFILLYITEGEGTHYIDFKPYKYRSQTLIVLSKNTISSFRVNPKAKGYIVLVNEDFFIENSDIHDFNIINFFDAQVKNPLIKLDTSKQTTSRAMIDLLYKESLTTTKNNQLLLKSLFTSFIYSVRKETNINIEHKKINVYKNFYNYKNLVEKNFKTLKQVSDYQTLMNLTRKTINKCCRDSAGITAKDLITSRIILEVKRLLVIGEMKNFEISYALGYDEPSNLATLFKKNVGISMSEYKETFKKNRKIV